MPYPRPTPRHTLHTAFASSASDLLTSLSTLDISDSDPENEDIKREIELLRKEVGIWQGINNYHQDIEVEASHLRYEECQKTHLSPKRATLMKSAAMMPGAGKERVVEKKKGDEKKKKKKKKNQQIDEERQNVMLSLTRESLMKLASMKPDAGQKNEIEKIHQKKSPPLLEKKKKHTVTSKRPGQISITVSNPRGDISNDARLLPQNHNYPGKKSKVFAGDDKDAVGILVGAEMEEKMEGEKGKKRGELEGSRDVVYGKQEAVEKEEEETETMNESTDDGEMAFL